MPPRIAIPRNPLPSAFMRLDPRAPVCVLSGETMGTVWRAQIVGGDAGRCRAVIDAVLADVIAATSHWEPTSELCRINRAPPDTRHALSPAFATVIAAALRVAGASDGAFDPAVGALVDLWGFGPPGPRSDVPTGGAIADARARSGWRHLHWEAGSRTLTLTRTAAVALDLSGIAKGYAVDAVAAALRTLGHRDFLVEIGGEFAGSGLRPDGQPWWVDVEPVAGAARLRIALHDHAVATSGDTQRRFVADGVPYSHSIDPRTGWPIANGVAQVTVLHPDCMWADAWASAITVLGPDAGMALATREGLAVRIVANGVEGMSAALRRMV